MVSAIGERFVDEDREIECVWCGEEIDHEGVIRTTDSEPACFECVETRPWEGPTDG